MQNSKPTSADSEPNDSALSKPKVIQSVVDMDDLLDTLKDLYPIAEINSSNDAFIILLHAFMLEVGFIPKDVPESEKLKLLPKDCLGNELYSIIYCHSSCPEISCSMTCFPLYEQLSVFGTITDACISQEPPNICLQVNSYVNKDSIGSSDLSKTFSNVRELSQSFKDKFAYPLLAVMQDALGFGPTFGLVAVMDNVKMQILRYLHVGGLVAMSCVNKEFNELCNSTSLWKRLYLKDFPDDGSNCEKTNQDWKRMYKEKYVKKRQRYRYFPLPLRNIRETMEERHPALYLPPPFGPDFLIGVGDMRIPFPDLQPVARPHHIVRPPPFPHNPLLKIPHIFQL